MSVPTDASVRRVWLKRVGYAAGVLLLLGAIATVFSRRATITAALGAVTPPAPGPAAALLACVFANIALSAVFLRLLLLRFGRVGSGEMLAVVSATTLLNFLPLRPGLFGRIAYHRQVNGIRVADTARTVVEAAVISVAIVGVLAVVIVVNATIGWSLWAGAISPLPILAVVAISSPWRLWALVILVRYAEVFVWALRYHLAFVLLEAPVPPHVALAFACVSVMATMIPFISNGLGVREWAIGLLAPVLTTHRLELGVTAELVNRAAELLVIGGAGVVAMAWLARRGQTAGLRPPDHSP
ncbi:MAG: hypothetical protein HKO59_05260 [Phycisphaerales bacterium]|nr:hypothetical protein [Phycisphaerae bacterium]NNF42997.1 hypothetical protein [Phycisphaerales bacterium]NNM25382.1 hypothetical protein [Phycisphaerales bacterium]